ncbi:hypothetical protein [Muricoccus nepalensis]|uniref:hypothetical protein n=1 Tax=Muricoccus nepalensis TaxID=1854500 RepID=UPI00112D4864|nr:hypothetical protein [Roseomonas nepalensis]
MKLKLTAGLFGLATVVAYLGQEHDLFAAELKPVGPLLTTAERVCPAHRQSRTLHDIATRLRGTAHWDEGLSMGSARWNEARYQKACQIVTNSL